MSESPPENTGTRQILSGYLKSVNGLAAVESLIKEKLSSEATILSEISSYLLELGGKRIRPAICLIAARALGQPANETNLIEISAGIELIHMATLLHDDIIDKSKIRRHKSSAFEKYGMTSTLLTGDFLLVRAFSLCSRLDPYIIEKTEQACVDLTEGEVLELPLHEKSHDLESSLFIARKKTASLFRLACESAAFLCSKDAQVISAMAMFGENLGLAFQIFDDILDITADKETLGKEPGSDIKEKKPSIVNVLWLDSGDSRALKLTEAEELSQEFVNQSIAYLKDSKIIKSARSIAEKYALSASQMLTQAESLSAHPDQGAFSALRGLIDYCLKRME